METKRRRHPRFKHRTPVSISFSGKTLKGLVSNISKSGLFIQSDQLPPSGQEIELKLMLSRGDEVELKGKVMWVRAEALQSVTPEPAGMGVELQNPPSKYHEFVAGVREQLAKRRRGDEQRFEVSHPVQFSSGHEFLSEYIENLSRGGMYLATEQPLEMGKVIQAKLEIPGLHTPIEIEGRVQYVLTKADAENMGRSSGAGVQFVDLSPEAVAYLHHYIKRLEIHRQTRERRRQEAIPDRGSLKDFIVPEILLGLLQKEVSGTLLLSHQQTKKAVFFKNGHPVYVRSSLRGETLGHYLLRNEVITKEQFEQTLKQLTQRDMQHGEILIREGIIDPGKLAEYLVEHQEEKLSNTFAWMDGEFKFMPDTEWPEDISIFTLRTYQVIFRGVQRWYDAAVLGAWMGLDEKTLLKRLKMPPATAVVLPQVLRLLQSLNEHKSVEEIAVELKLMPEDVLPLAFGVIIAGWVGIQAPGQVKKKKPEEPKPLPKPSADIEALKKRILEDHKRLRGLDFYQLFEMKGGVDEKKLSMRYVALSSKYSSKDLEQVSEPEVRAKAAEILSWIRTAYETLKDPRLRHIYTRRGARRGTGEGRLEALGADLVLLPCLRDIDRGNFSKVVERLSDGVKNYPADSMLKGYLGWALYQIDPRANLQRASDLLDGAIKGEPADAQLRYFRGEILAYLGNWQQAEQFFSDALRLQPSFIKAEAAFEKAKAKRISIERMARQSDT